MAITPALDALIDRHYRRVLARYWPPERHHVETGYRELDFPFAERAVPALAIEHDWDCEQLLGYIASWSAVQRLRADRGENADLEFRAALRAAWGDPARPRRLRWPLSLRVGRLDSPA